MNNEDRPDPRDVESWCREGVMHDHAACGNLWDPTSQHDMRAAVKYADDLSAGRGAAPTFTVDYRDRFATVMLATRKAGLESYGLMKEAREVEELMVRVRTWQVEHIDQLTPTPGVVPVNLHERWATA